MISIAKSMINFSEWYSWVVREGGFKDQRTPTKGVDVFLPWGYAVWENIQRTFDAWLKENGIQNYYFPLFIPKSLLMKESEHFEGFAPEVAWVTLGGSKELADPLAVRPTSEVIMYYMFKYWIRGYRDLPLKVNQWCNIVRWETKATKPFIRDREILWHECHTAHRTKEDAMNQVFDALELYRELMEQYCALPVFILRRSELDKFSGAEKTYALETILKDGKLLQIGTAHLLDQGFAHAYDIKFRDENGESKYVWQTSWGFSTRLIGAIIMTHGDEHGAIIPPRVAPIQLIIVPINKKGIDVSSYALEILDTMKSAGIRVYIDLGDETPGFKFNKWDLKGVPLRAEIGPIEMDTRTITIVRRDTKQKYTISLSEIGKIFEIMDQMQSDMLSSAKERNKDKIHRAKTLDEINKHLEEHGGFVKVDWCESEECELHIKQHTLGEIRGYDDLEPEDPQDKCIVCGKPAKKVAYVGDAY